MASGKKKMTVGKGLAIAVGSLLGLAAVAVAGFNIYIHATYADFYQQARQEFPIPDINGGFVPQDMAWLEGSQQWLFSGYMGDHGPSPLYRTSESGTNVVKFFVTNPDGSTYVGHGGGVTADGQFTFLTTEGGYLVLNTQEVATAEEGAQVQAIAQVDIGIDPAFINIQNGALYTGVFYYETDYPTPAEQHLTAPDGTQNKAVMYVFDADADGEFGYANGPSRVFSIPDRVQGVCFNSQGQMVLSCSWGAAGVVVAHLRCGRLATAGHLSRHGGRCAAVLPGFQQQGGGFLGAAHERGAGAEGRPRMVCQRIRLQQVHFRKALRLRFRG